MVGDAFGGADLEAAPAFAWGGFEAGEGVEEGEGGGGWRGGEGWVVGDGGDDCGEGLVLNFFWGLVGGGEEGVLEEG